MDNRLGFLVQDGSNNRFVDNVASNDATEYLSRSDPIEGPALNNTVENLHLDSATVSFESKDVRISTAETVPDDPENLTNIGQYVNATNTSGDSFLDLDVHYEEGNLGDVDESTLELWRYDEDWSPVPGSTVDTEANVVSANISEYSVFAPLGEQSQSAEDTPSETPPTETPTDQPQSTPTAETPSEESVAATPTEQPPATPTKETPEPTAVSTTPTDTTSETTEETPETTEEQKAQATDQPVESTAAAHYQVDLVVGEPIENLRSEEGYYTPDRLVRFAHGSSMEPVTRRSDGEFITDEKMAACIESQEVSVEDGQATTTFTVANGCEPVELTLASYEKVGPGWSPETEAEQQFVDSETDTFGPGTYTLNVTLPDSETERPEDDGNEARDTASGELSLAGLSADADGVDDNNLNDEFLTYENTGNAPLDLSDWMVEDSSGTTYTFHDGFTLAPGDQVTLFTGSGSDTDTELYWGTGKRGLEQRRGLDDRTQRCWGDGSRTLLSITR